MPANTSPMRRRLTREQRARQLLEVAWTLVGEEGTDALTLGRQIGRASCRERV